ncbi:hypothetical protein AGRA3207_005306 [Actinomadura graeca]|uniref:DUF4129 domain-containing protein n=1 Tax=Actinomadura graeca TaxID=2750812 RepID=A0ABX8QYY2_9ACTN|nr:hypothetical protein [Actinomadura graeca]QXJ24055.1 hypothetical protein AGRA3207_005306 [Actinomadura graeca]
MSEELTQLARLFREHGLAAGECPGPSQAVTNPVSSSLREVVSCPTDRYLTNWGYEVGERGQVRAMADRLALLLGGPGGEAR